MYYDSIAKARSKAIVVTDANGALSLQRHILQGGLKASCIGPVLSKFHQSVEMEQPTEYPIPQDLSV